MPTSYDIIEQSRRESDVGERVMKKRATKERAMEERVMKGREIK